MDFRDSTRAQSVRTNMLKNQGASVPERAGELMVRQDTDLPTGSFSPWWRTVGPSPVRPQYGRWLCAIIGKSRGFCPGQRPESFLNAEHSALNDKGWPFGRPLLASLSLSLMVQAFFTCSAVRTAA